MWRTVFFRLPRLAALFLLVALAGGVGAVLSLGRQEDPTLIERFGFVLTTLPGADAERMEALVTEPIEAALLELPEIEELFATSRAGVSQINIDIDENLSEAEVDDAWTLIRQQVEIARADLPAGASVPEVNRQYVGAHTALVALSWAGEGEPELAVLNRMAQALEDRLRAVPGTEETERFGAPEEEIRVVVDPGALSAAGLNTREAAARIAQADARAPAGQLRTGRSNLGVEVSGEFDSIARIRSVPLVQRSDGTAIRVGDVADVRKGLEDPPSSLNFTNGRRSILVGAFIQSGQRVDQWSRGMREVVETYRASAPSTVDIDIVFDQAVYTASRLNGLTANLAYSAMIVFAVLFFVMGWRAALVVGTALPLTVCLVLILFNLFGMPLHQMSVTGLVISLGLLIDNAIVVVDEYDQKRSRGVPPLEAGDQSLAHLAGPLFASTLTTALAFAPIALMPGSAGEFIGMLGISVIFAVSSSFLISMTVIPAMAGWFDRPRRPGEPRRWWRDGLAFDTISDGYRWSVGVVLAFPPLGLALGLAPALIGFALGGTLPLQFFPQTERNQFQVELTLPAEASIEQTLAATTRATALLREYPEVQSINWTLGETAPRVYYNVFNNSNGVAGFAAGWVELDSAESTRRIISGVQARMRMEFPEAQFLTLPFEQGPPAPAPVEFKIFGPNLDVLNRLGNETRRVLAGTPGITYTTGTQQLGAPVVVLNADEAASTMAGEALVDLAGDLRAELDGLLAGSVLEGVEELPVRVIAPNSRRSDLSDLRAKTVGADAAGLGAPISALGDIELNPEAAIITRIDGQRVNAVRAFTEPYALPAPIFADFEKRLAESGFELPPGYSLSVGGESENRTQAMGNLLGAAVPLILVMAGAVALVFNSFRMSLLILTTGFLALGMAFFGVWLFNLPMGFNAILGGLGLLGIAINGSIVVLSALKASPEACADDVVAQRETVVDATRHIVATTLTTMGGFAPIILTGDNFWLPLATGIAGGGAGSAILALYFTPAGFRLMTMRPFSRGWAMARGRTAPAGLAE